jgi:hypothetical protein
MIAGLPPNAWYFVHWEGEWMIANVQINDEDDEPQWEINDIQGRSIYYGPLSEHTKVIQVVFPTT